MPLSLLSPLDRWKSPVPKAKKVAWLNDATFAHRGLHGPGVPENSPTAFARAIARGLGIECDVRRSYDGQAMVFHDGDLERMTGIEGRVSRRGSKELEQIRLIGGSEQDTIPTLRTLLRTIDGKVPLLIEIKSRKDYHYTAICLAVRRVLEGYLGPHAVMSFDPRVTRWFADHSPLTVRGLVVTEDNDKTLAGRLKRRQALWLARPDFLAYDVRDLPSAFAAEQRARGLPLATWTVRDAELKERALDYADASIAEASGF